MNYLIDTHAFLWLISEPKTIKKQTLAKLQNANNILFLSVASVWEISIKYRIGKLALPQAPEKFVSKHLQKNDIMLLDLTLKHAATEYQIPVHHKDPFDRIIINQAMQEKLTIVSADTAFKKYQVKLLEV